MVCSLPNKQCKKMKYVELVMVSLLYTLFGPMNQFNSIRSLVMIQLKIKLLRKIAGST